MLLTDHFVNGMRAQTLGQRHVGRHVGKERCGSVHAGDCRRNRAGALPEHTPPQRRAVAPRLTCCRGAAPCTIDAGRTAIAAGSMPGSGAILQPTGAVPETGRSTAGLSNQIPNEYLEYEEDFRAHYDEQYAAENSRYEDYAPAYRYGAEIGRDTNYHDRQWDDIEPEARRHWETTSADSTWERFKLAVRHGWERVTGHHHV